jgi:hypothetical protein
LGCFFLFAERSGSAALRNAAEQRLPQALVMRIPSVLFESIRKSIRHPVQADVMFEQRLQPSKHKRESFR